MPDYSQELSILLLSVLYALVGLALLLIGYRVVDRFIPEDAHKKIFEEGNVAVAVLMSAFVLGLALVVAAAIGG